MPTPIRIPFPAKGINRNFARSDQNGVQQGVLAQFLPETVWDAVNVMPYDRYDRLRGGQRGGTFKKFTLQMNTSFVQAIKEIVVGGQAAQSLIQTVVFEDTFVAGSSLSLHAYNSAYECNVASHISTFAGYTAMMNFTPQTSGNTYKVTVAGGLNDAFVETTGQLQGNAFLYDTTNNPPPASYTIQLNCPIISTSDTAEWFININCVTASGVQAANAQTAYFVASGGQIQANLWATPGAFIANSGGSPDTQAQTPTVVTTSAFTLALQVTPTTLSVLVNGVSYGTIGFTPQPGTAIEVCTTKSQAAGSPPTQTITSWWYTATVNSPVYRVPGIVAVCGGNIYTGDNTSAPGTWTLTKATWGGSTAYPLVTNNLASITTFNNVAYIVDGTNFVGMSYVNKVATPITAAAGTLPTNVSIITTWHGRLCLAGDSANPQNFYMSRVGTPTDFNYSATDSAAAFAGSASAAGFIAQPITALMPFNDDVMLIGGDHNMWVMNGDPAQGGSIDLVSDGIGVYGPNAWTKDSIGTIYFMGPGGFYSVVPGAKPTLLSGNTLDNVLSKTDQTFNYVSLQFDNTRHGVWIFITPINGTTAGTHFFYDLRNGGLWPVKFPTAQGPTVACPLLGTDAVNYFVLLGGFDGYIRATSVTQLDDDGTAISAYMVLGPFQPNPPTGDAVVTSMDFTTGENLSTDSTALFNLTWQLNGGKTAYEVTEGMTVGGSGFPRRFVAGTFTYPGYQSTRVQRLRGGWFTLTLSNSTVDTYFSMEHAVLHVEQQGKQR